MTREDPSEMNEMSTDSTDELVKAVIRFDTEDYSV
jgi:hypothetical protein